MIKLNPALRDFWQTPKKYKILKGGRVSSKTEDTAGYCVYLAYNYNIKFLCLRQFQNKIADSVYPIIKRKIYEAGKEGEFDFTLSSITCLKTGSSFIFHGIDRNTESIKGMEGIGICWIEEGEGLTKEQWGIIDPTVRMEGSEVWIIYNPRQESDFIEEELPPLLGDEAVIRHINYDENPFISRTSLDKINRLKAADEELYRHIYLGVALNDDDSVIIPRSWIDAAIDAHLKLDINQSDNIIGFDVADSGADKCATVLFTGNVAIASEEWSAEPNELYESSVKVYAQAIQHNARVVYDCIGVGAGTGSNLKRMNTENYTNVGYSGFNAGAQVVDPDDEYNDTTIPNKVYFENSKAQTWWEVARLFSNTYNAITKGTHYEPTDLISISSKIGNLQQLRKELSTPRKDYSNAGKIMVESKKNLAKRDVPSPNLADAFVMPLAPISKGRRSILDIDLGGLL